MTQGPERDIDVLDRLIKVAGRRIVDAGCGAGDLARALVERGAEVVALEPEPGQAAINRERLAGGAIAFHQAGAEAMPLDDSCADGVIFSKSLHHVPVELMARALGEALRVLRPGGFLLVIEPETRGSHSELMKPFHDETREREAAREALAEATAEAFDRSEEVRYFNRRVYDSFPGFVDEVTGNGYNAIPRAAVDTPDVRARFEAGRRAGGYAFDQPMRVNLLSGRR